VSARIGFIFADFTAAGKPGKSEFTNIETWLCRKSQFSTIVCTQREKKEGE
jgi:hypothetical protein